VFSSHEQRKSFVWPYKIVVGGSEKEMHTN